MSHLMTFVTLNTRSVGLIISIIRILLVRYWVIVTSHEHLGMLLGTLRDATPSYIVVSHHFRPRTVR